METQRLEETLDDALDAMAEAHHILVIAKDTESTDLLRVLAVENGLLSKLASSIERTRELRADMRSKLYARAS